MVLGEAGVADDAGAAGEAAVILVLVGVGQRWFLGLVVVGVGQRWFLCFLDRGGETGK